MKAKPQPEYEANTYYLLRDLAPRFLLSGNGLPLVYTEILSVFYMLMYRNK